MQTQMMNDGGNQEIFRSAFRGSRTPSVWPVNCAGPDACFE